MVSFTVHRLKPEIVVEIRRIYEECRNPSLGILDFLLPSREEVEESKDCVIIRGGLAEKFLFHAGFIMIDSVAVDERWECAKRAAEKDKEVLQGYDPSW